MESVTHIAFVMDGNGRWAESRGLPRSFGHKAGSEVIRDVVRTAVRLNIKYMTLFGLSCDNFIKRPKAEVDDLMTLMRECLEQYLDELINQGVKLLFIGDIEGLDPDVSKKIYQAMDASKHNTRIVVTIAVNFSGQWHIISTTKKLLALKDQLGRMLTDQEIESAYANLLPSAPDILIRTGGNTRISDFVMYHLGYTELFFLDVKWPDFKEEHLLSVLDKYHQSERRFGGLKEEAI